MFIVEGLDYAGKTTALERLQDLISEKRWRRWYGHSFINQIQRWGKLSPDFDYCRSYIMAAHKEQLCDRFVLSELAYGQVFRGGPNTLFDSHARRRVQRELNVTGSVTLLVKCDYETTLERAKTRCASDFDASMKIRQIYEQGTGAFQQALDDLAVGRRGGTFLGEYDTSRLASGRYEPGEIEALAIAHQDRLEWYLDQWKTHLERSKVVMNECPQSWGYLWPKVLLVGENINHPTACRPFAGDESSSRTLTDLLDMAQLGEKDLYFWNAYTFRGEPLLTRQGVALLQPRVIVALGKRAGDRLEALAIKHVAFPHPQWIGRFQRKEMATWAQNLKSLVAPALTS